MLNKKTIFLATAGMLALAACSKTGNPNDEPMVQSAEEVSFGAYLSRSTTKAGLAGTELTSSDGTSNLQTEGFGVFGYYTDGELYSDLAKPNFMYNQKVNYSGGSWTYSPAKYWPNEFGTQASADEVDRLTFFAYAPWVDVSAASGSIKSSVYSGAALTTGITGLSRATAAGDPLVKYVASFSPAESVDLCWGVAKSDFNATVTTEFSNDIDAGYPYIDVAKPTISSRVDFDFKHALSSLNVQIDTDVDVVSHNDGELEANTKIYVRSVTFEGFSVKGALNLNSNATDGPNWVDIAGSERLSSAPVTVYDGRRDGKEGVANASDANEKPQGLNEVLIQNQPYSGTPTAGVVHTPVNLFSGSALESPIFVIPNGETLKVTIVYDVETKDSKLSTFLSDGVTLGSTVENTITKTISSSTDPAVPFVMECGKRYVIRLHLGLTSVKFDANVSDWGAGSSADVDTPVNAS